MKFVILLVCLLHAISGESVELRRTNGKGTKRAASSVRGKPELLRVDPNVCFCLDKVGDIVVDCDLTTLTCDAPYDFLTFNCYGDLMDLEKTYEKTYDDAKWENIRDAILLNGFQGGDETDDVWMSLMKFDKTCLGELENMVTEEKRIQETPKFQATIRKIKIKGALEDYRSSSVIVDIVGLQQVSDIAVDICFNNICSGIKSFAKIISHTFASKSWTSWDEGAVKVMGELLRSEATFTAKARNIDLAKIGVELYEFLGGAAGRIADIVITFTASRLDVKKTHVTAILNKNGHINMMYGDILIGGMSLENFED